MSRNSPAPLQSDPRLRKNRYQSTKKDLRYRLQNGHPWHFHDKIELTLFVLNMTKNQLLEMMMYGELQMLFSCLEMITTILLCSQLC